MWINGAQREICKFDCVPLVAGCKCTVCGEPVPVTPPSGRFFRICEQSTGDKPKEPGIFTKITRYANAVLKWELAGKPLRSESEIESILKACEACPHYKIDDRPRCGLCGCSVNSSTEGLKNKIAMATESCPLPKPRW